MAVVLLMGTQVQAQEVKTILDSFTWNNGVGYAVKNKGITHISTLDIASWKSLTLEAGYTGQIDDIDNAAVALLSVKLLDMKDVIKFPVLDKISFRPGIGLAYGPISKGEGKTDILLTMSVLSLKF